jgi:hypothetical protein
VAQLMSQLRLGLDASSWRSASARSKTNRKRAGEVFWSRGGELKRGVWMRKGAGVVPIMLVARTVTYRPRIDMPRIGEAIGSAVFALHLDRETSKAWATAR